MAVFSYAAKTLSGQEQNGSREAKDKFELARSLREEGFILINADEARAKRAFELPSIFGRVSIADKMIFARNLSVMVAAGLPLARSLEILTQESRNKTFKDALIAIASSIKGGANFSESLRAYPRIFPPLFVAMVGAGEKSGNLEGSLKLIAHQLKRDYDLRRKIRGAMVYPAVILFAMFGIGILMLVYVVPTLVATFEDLDMQLPLMTRIVIGISNFFLHNFILGLALILLFIASVFGAARSRRGKAFLDSVILKIPVIKTLAKKNNAARTCRTFGSLIGSGVDILEALTITGDVLQNHYYKKIIEEARGGVERGEALSKTFIANSKLYPSLVGEMMAIGEETGKLSEMLFRLAVFYENEVGQATKDLSTIVEPALMIIIGVVVGLFAVSMVQPLYSVVGSF